MTSATEESASPALKILLVDDTPANVSMMRAALEMVGHSVAAAVSGEEALEKFAQVRPDVVLMDVRMPGIGGIEATRRLRRLAGDRWLPIVFISALSHSDDMVLGLEAGGDDYLAKPVDLALLLAKIRALQRVVVLQDKLRAANASLADYRQAAARDMAMATAVMQCMVQSAAMEIPGVERWLEPAAELSGDLLVARTGSDGRIYLLLADAMGHGLPAALPVIPLLQVFSSLTRAGSSVPAIAREMNLQLKAFLPTGNFVAVTLACVDRANHFVDLWNGGNPPALLSTGDGSVIQRFAARHPALGILSDTEFDAGSEACQCPPGARLTICSDGLLEAADASGEAFGAERLAAALHGAASLHPIKQALFTHLAGRGPADDISLASVTL